MNFLLIQQAQKSLKLPIINQLFGQIPWMGLLFFNFNSYFTLFLRTLDYVKGDIEFVTTLIGVS